MFSENKDGQGQPRENEENKERCPEDDVGGGSAALTDPSLRRLAEAR